jgi:hypothetical protein
MASIEKALQIAARAHEMTKPAGWRPARSDDPSSRLDEPVDRSNRRRLA